MRKKNIQKNIQNVDYKTKYIGRGKLIKKNKVLISVLTTSAFLFPAFSASAESISIDGNNSNPLQMTNFSALLKTDVVEFPAEFNAYTKDKGNTDATSKAAKVDRFVFGNFGAWKNFDNWGDDRTFSTIGAATAEWSKFVGTGGPGSGYQMALNSSNANSGIKWNLKLMPNTNYTFTFENNSLNFKNMVNPKIVINDTKTNTNLYTSSSIDTSKSITLHSFKTLPSSAESEIEVQILGVANNQKISGDFYFTADKPAIAVDADNNYKAFYKLSEAPGGTVKEILEKNDLVYYDTANNNSRINPNFDATGNTAVNENTVGNTTKTFNGKVNAEKWGIKSGLSDYELVVTNDIQLKKDLDDAAAKTKEKIAKDDTLTQTQKDAQNMKVDDATKAAKKAIDDAKNPTDIENAAKTGKTEIEKQYQAGTPIADQKTKAIADIDKVIADTKKSN